jgi:hypothetical protein
MSKAVRLLGIAPILALLAWAGSAAIQVIRADDLVREAATEMSAWSAARVDPAPDTRDSVQEKLEEGLRVRPGDPSSQELLGLLLSARRDDSAKMDEGIAHLVRALEQRPVSPYTWANLLEARYRRGEAIERLELALTRASQLGPSEPGVQRIVADYGLALWPELSPTARTEVDRTVASGMRRNPLEMLRISDRRGRLEAACRHVVGAQPADPRIGRACEGWEITP